MLKFEGGDYTRSTTDQ